MNKLHLLFEPIFKFIAPAHDGVPPLLIKIKRSK